MRKVGIHLNKHFIKFKQTNMLCSKCVMHVLKVLTKIEEIQELEVDLDKKLIKVVFNNESIAKESLMTMVNNAIEGIRPFKLSTIT